MSRPHVNPIGPSRILSFVVTIFFLIGTVPSAAAGPERKAGEFTLKPGTFETLGKEYDAEYGSIWVPMNRNDPKSRLIELKFVRIKSTSAAPLSPIVYLAGGPGGSGIGAMQSSRARAFVPFLDVADVIGFDQRGTGDSEPNDMMFESTVGLALDEPGDPAKYLPLAREKVRLAVEAMRERGIDLDGFTTEQSADDLEDLRRALGARKLTLWGSSYGTHLALVTVRRHPRSVDRIILAGTEGPNHSYKLPSNIQINLERLAELVARDEVYRKLMPDFLGTLKAVLDDLDANPRSVDIMPGTSVVVGKWDLQKMLSGPMGSRSGMEAIPAQVYAMSKGEFTDLGGWAFTFRRPRRTFTMSVAMDCASWATADRLARIEREAKETLLGAAIDFPYPGWCEGADLPRLDDDFRSKLVSDVPALFVSGTLDGRTPVSNAEEIARGFKNSRHLVIRNASHGGDLFGSSPKILEVVRAFITDEPIPYSEIDGPEWDFEPPYERSLEGDVVRTLAAEGYEAAVKHYQSIRKRYEGQYVYDFRERKLNGLGYNLMRAGMELMALNVFRLNTVAYPEAFNTWDSLAECYMEMGDKANAILYYKKSLELNPENSNAVRMLARLEKED